MPAGRQYEGGCSGSTSASRSRTWRVNGPPPRSRERPGDRAELAEGRLRRRDMSSAPTHGTLARPRAHPVGMPASRAIVRTRPCSGQSSGGPCHRLLEARPGRSAVAPFRIRLLDIGAGQEKPPDQDVRIEGRGPARSRTALCECRPRHCDRRASSPRSATPARSGSPGVSARRGPATFFRVTAAPARGIVPTISVSSGSRSSKRSSAAHLEPSAPNVDAGFGVDEPRSNVDPISSDLQPALQHVVAPIARSFRSRPAR